MGGFYMTPDIYGIDPYVQIPAASGASGALSALYGIFAMFYYALVGFLALMYIFQSIGLFTIAKRRGIQNPWLAWIPVGDVWILGSISDQYQYVTKGRVCNRRKLLMALMIGVYALLVPLTVAVVFMSVSIAGEMSGAFVISILILLLCYLVMLALAVIFAVFFYIALYDVYASCNPSGAAGRLVLSILFDVSMPFFLFFGRNKELGMPPRRENPQPAPQPYGQPVVQPVILPVAEQAPVVEEAPVVEQAPAAAETAEETE